MGRSLSALTLWLCLSSSGPEPCEWLSLIPEGMKRTPVSYAEESETVPAPEEPSAPS